MMRVLRRLGFIDNENVVQLKGRTACEISACDELLVAELIFNGVFSELSVEHTVALLSALVHTEKGTDSVKIRDDLAGPFRQLQEAARRVAKVWQFLFPDRLLVFSRWASLLWALCRSKPNP